MANQKPPSDWTSLGFILLYLSGVLYNLYLGNSFYVLLWGFLLLLNLGLFIYRKVRKEDKDVN